MVRAGRALMLALALLWGVADPAPAQSTGRALGGASLGVAGGAVVTFSAIVWRARFQREYLESAEDLVHWTSLPMVVTPAVGVVFGLAGRPALVGSFVGSVAGMVAGSVAGAGVGWIVSRTPESPWAGGVIGAGIGLSLGGIAGGLREWSRDENAELDFPEVLRLSVRVPVP